MILESYRLQSRSLLLFTFDEIAQSASNVSVMVV